MEAVGDPTGSGLAGAASVMGVRSSEPARKKAELCPADRYRLPSRPPFVFDTGHRCCIFTNDDRGPTAPVAGRIKELSGVEVNQEIPLGEERP